MAGKTHFLLEFLLVCVTGSVILFIIGFIMGLLLHSRFDAFLFFKISPKALTALAMFSYSAAAVICFHKR